MAGYTSSADLPGQGLHKKTHAGGYDAFISKIAFGNTVKVARSGSGSGTVTSDPSGIDCGKTCSASYKEDTVVTLTAKADSSSTFTGWSGGCSGTGECVIAATDNFTITATFSLNGPSCTYTITPTGPKTFTSKPGTVSLTVKGTGETKTTVCTQPAVTSSDEWITAAPSTWKNNKQTVKVGVNQNDSSTDRGGSVAVADKTYTITQKGAPCAITKLTPSSQQVPATGNSYTFEAAVAPQDCTWKANANKTWIQVTSGAGTGTGNVGYAVPANTTKKTQSGAITVTLDQNEKKKSFTVKQVGK